MAAVLLLPVLMEVNSMGFNIVRHIGVLKYGSNITTELNIVEWVYPRYDIRRWELKDGEKMPYEGITLTVEEVRVLKDILNSLEI